jgi:FAD/FMN-containing dehydrogenase
VVTADGEPRQVSSDADADLHWALRGGGGGYAIVTALHLDLLPISEVYAGALIFPAEVGAPAIRAYRDWAAEVPEEVTSSLRYLRPPPLPTVPEPIRDRPLIVALAAYIGSEAEGEELVAPLREIGEPIMDTFAQIPAAGLGRISMDPEDPVPGMGQAGGALGRPADDAGALGSLDAAFVLVGIGVPMDPKMAPAIAEGLDRLVETMKPWAADGGFFNFAERPCDVDALLPADTCSRLAEVKRSWDPDGVIIANHSVSLTG